jgi:ABC-type multidrug transport system ATPase subunit/pSer/pThr/pTyr-binding forkhead associated (FHA) protein
MFGVFTIESLGKSEEYPLAQARVELGRGEDNDLTLPFPTVSLHHARLVADAAGCRIMDLGSANGTFVNGAEIPVKQEMRLHEGDLVEIGPFKLRFHAPSVVRPVAAPAAGGGHAAAEAGARARPGHTVVLPPSLPPRLAVSTPDWSRELPLTKDSLTLGRGEDNDLVVPAEAVSRHHATLERRGDGFLITDLGSTNGLNIGGRPLQEKLLAPGDHVCVGRTVTLTYLGAEDLAAEMAAELRGGPGPAAGAAFAPGAARAQVYDIPEGDALVLGRGAETGVHLAHPQVDVEHAQVRRQEGQYVIQDLGSSGGTFVNGQLVSRQALREGDLVRIGPNQLVIKDGRLQLMSEEGRLRLDAFHLSKVVGKGQRILSDVSLSIKPQEFVAVVGGSGAGKSTLVNALCGFKPATEGAVMLNGVDLYQNFDAYRNEMGYVPQDDIIHVDLSVYKALDYAARLRMPADTSPHELEQRVREVIDELDLKACADRAIKQLSGGQRKRVSIGVELLTRPSLFFLDEATSGLDPATEAQMMKLLRKLADQGRTIILITHATKNVMACDKVVFLTRGGYLAYFGPPEDALQYFGVKDFDEIYECLESAASPEEWAARYLASPQLQEYVVKPLNEVAQAWSGPPAGRPAGGFVGPGGDGGGYAAATPGGKVRRSSSWSQFWILSGRYLHIIRRDKKTLVLLLAISPVLGVLDFVTWQRDLFDPVDGSATKVVTMLFMACLVGVLVGTITSVREIVKEDPIYRRERMVCVQVFPYVASKVAVGSIFALYSAVVLFLFKVVAVDFSHLSAVGYLELLVTFVLCTFAGLMWGLLVSAVAPTEDRAMLLVILVLVPQFVFSGGLMPVADLGMAGKIFGALTSTRWGLGAMATVAEIETGACKARDLSDCVLPGIKGLDSVEKKVALADSLHKQYGAIFHVNVLFYWAMSVVLIVGLLGIIYVLQKRKDTL